MQIIFIIFFLCEFEMSEILLPSELNSQITQGLLLPVNIYFDSFPGMLQNYNHAKSIENDYLRGYFRFDDDYNRLAIPDKPAIKPEDGEIWYNLSELEVKIYDVGWYEHISRRTVTFPIYTGSLYLIEIIIESENRKIYGLCDIPRKEALPFIFRLQDRSFENVKNKPTSYGLKTVFGLLFLIPVLLASLLEEWFGIGGIGYVLGFFIWIFTIFQLGDMRRNYNRKLANRYDYTFNFPDPSLDKFVRSMIINSEN